MKVPFLDLKKQYLGIKKEIDGAIQQVIDKTAFSGGYFVEKFEKEFAAFCNCKHAIGVGSGTDALLLSLLALGLKKDDEVITVPNTFFATIEAIYHSGAKPVLVDIDPETYNMDTSMLERSVTERTRAIMPVHMFGQMAKMGEIIKIARKHKLFVIEDACQAHGAEYYDQKAGTIGNVGCFSFYPGKNIGAFGEAGSVVTNDDEIAMKVKMLRDHGQLKKYYHSMVGMNSRMDGIQAAVLSVKLRYLTGWNEKRREIAGSYNQMLQHFDEIVTPLESEGCRHIYHIYAIRTLNRGMLAGTLRKNGVDTGIHYPLTVNCQEAYENIEKKTMKCPKADEISNSLLSLPIYPEMTEEQTKFVVHVMSGELGGCQIEKVG